MSNDAAAPTRIRYEVLVLIGLAPACAYLPRIIAAFNTTLGSEFRISNEEVGGVIAGFALGYFVFQVPGGFLADAFGVRLVLPVMGFAWSLCAAWGGMADSADALFYSRVGMGIAQAGLVPCCAKAAADWFPLGRRGIVSAVLAASMQVGAVAATLLSAKLLALIGWRRLLIAYALFGAIWAVTFFIRFRNRPEDDGRTNEQERELINRGRGLAVHGAEKGDWRRTALAIAVNLSLWAYFAQSLFRAYGYEFFTSWFPAFLERACDQSTENAGALAAWPLVAYGVGSVLGGLVVDVLLARTGSLWLSRSGTGLLGLGVCALCFALATASHDAHFIVAVLSVGSLFAALGAPATWAAGMDLGGKHTPVIFGIMNMIGNIGSYYCPIHVGQLFDYIKISSGDWNLVLWLFVGINVAGALAWILVNPRRALAAST